MTEASPLTNIDWQQIKILIIDDQPSSALLSDSEHLTIIRKNDWIAEIRYYNIGFIVNFHHHHRHGVRPAYSFIPK
ncbi:hypothetical protein GRJ22_16645 [Photobacterium carnosum]|uniref:hypothetical protein n=1 Tax=Photobacterium carnosum TaxID=2023717 RepID=UPI001E5C9038|nr:hypothetical protein [Photobacterium carnosum]MCD9558026.1 hypothetical protein [Photobacterium carnosum]